MVTKLLSFLLLTALYLIGDPLLIDLRTDYQKEALGIEKRHPRLSWLIKSDKTGFFQSAYQIQASQSYSDTFIPDRWDSGWINSSTSTQVPYLGDNPKSHERIYWRVRIKDQDGITSHWSDITWFEMGLLSSPNWDKAKWISAYLKREPEYAPKEIMGDWITIEKSPSKGEVTYKYSFKLPEKEVVYAGAWWGTKTKIPVKVSLNNENARNSIPPNKRAFTDFSFYTKKGFNSLSLVVTKIPPNPAITFGMKIVFADGTKQIVRSSKNWKVCTGKSQNFFPVKVIQKYGIKPLGKALSRTQKPIPATWYKKDFSISKKVKNARLYISGLGYNEAYLNGRKIGDHVLDPGQTDYQEYGLYETFDVTKYISQESNAFSILLGDGWYNQDKSFGGAAFSYGIPGLRAWLRIVFKDGSIKNIYSDKSWQYCPSGTLSSNIYLGDHIDFRKESNEWQNPGFSINWKLVNETPPLVPKIIPQDFNPIRKIRTINPIKSWQRGEKTWVFDLGENISGWVGLKFNQTSGTTIRIRCTEMIDKNTNSLKNVPKSFWWCHGSPQRHTIIADGNPQVWEPKFSYQGFRYFEISGLDNPPKSGDVYGVVVHTDVPVTATFDCDNDLLKRIFKIGIQTHLYNMHSILQDCPHREKCLWGGDLHSSYAIGFNALNATRFYRQQVNLYYLPPLAKMGIPGNVGVGKRLTNHMSDFTWAVSPLFLAYRLYEIHGDIDTAKKHYKSMLKFLQYFVENSDNYIPKQAAHGDHAPPIDIKRQKQKKRLIAAMNFFIAAKRFAIIAKALDKPTDSQWGEETAQKIRASILKKYYDYENNTFGNGTQDSLALAFNILPPLEEKALSESLAGYYRKNGKKFDGGFMSYFIYNELTDAGYGNLAFEMLCNTDYPGLAWSIEKFDATTVWERFTYDKNMMEDRSLNHHAMNHPSAWLLSHLAGIRTDADNITLKPFIPKDLSWVKASISTKKGTIKSSWKTAKGKTEWFIKIPPNQRANVIFPKESGLNPTLVNSGEHFYKW